MSNAKLLTYAELSERTGIPRGTLGRWVSEGKIPHIRISNRMVRFDAVEVDAWLNSHRVPGLMHRGGEAA